MLQWSEDLYIGSTLCKGIRKIQRKLNRGRIVPGIYLITASANPRHLLEILPAMMVCQKSVYKGCSKIYGMARGKEEALELVCQMVQETYQNTGGFQIEQYMRDR